MWSVHFTIPLTHNNFIFIGTINIFRTKHRLPSGFYTTCRCKNIIHAISLIQLRAFDSMLIILISIKYFYRFTYKSHAIRLHFLNMENTFIANAAFCYSSYQICFSIIIPKWAWINPACACTYVYRLRPFAVRIFCGSHKNSLIRCRKAYIKQTFAITY